VARTDRIDNEGSPRKRYATRAQRRFRSIFRRFGLELFNRNGILFVQAVPEFLMGQRERFQALSRLLLMIANVEQIGRDGVEGAIAELGVWKGNSAAILHALLPERELYLLDTFQGFDDRDVDERQAEHHGAFADTSVDAVRSLVGDSPRIHFVQGRFPETASAIPAEERFAFVHLDCDLYTPIRAGLEYFYTRMSPGGAMLIHDYGSGSWPGVTRACDEFCRSVGVRLVLFPDKSGSALLVTPRSDPRIAPV
jgi:O-methyltransferase